MTNYLKSAVLYITIGVSLFQFPVISTAQAKRTPAPPAPIPAQILAARKVFVSNAGGEEPWDEDSQFSGGADRAYNQFYAAMKTAGRYELASAPADADLLFEIQFTCPSLGGIAAANADTLGGRRYDPQFRLAIRDAKTNALLWVFSERAQWAITRGNRDKNFDAALDKIVSDMQALTASPGNSASVASPDAANPSAANP